MSEELARSFIDLFNAKLELALAELKLHITDEFRLKLTDAASELFVEDFISDPQPNTPDSIAHARWRDDCNRAARNRLKGLEWTDIVVEAFTYLILKTPRGSTGPFILNVATTPDMISCLTAPFITCQNHDFFKKLKAALLRKRERDDPPDIRGTPLANIFPLRDTFGISLKRFATHGIIVAPPNHGKTQLLQLFIHGVLTDDDPPGLIVMDPHGDLFKTLRPRVHPDRLVVLDPETDPPELNFLDFGSSTQPQALQTFEYLMSAISGGLSDKQGGIVPYLLKLLRLIPDASIETLRQLVEDRPKKGHPSIFEHYIEQLPPIDQGFFRNQFYGSNMQPTKDAIAWKLYAALSSDAFRTMFTATTNSFNADAILNERKVCLITKGDHNVLGQHGTDIFFQFLLSQFYSAALRRAAIPEQDRHLSILFADEAHRVFKSPIMSNVLTECRKYGLGLCAATQVIEQIPTEVKAAIYGATAIKFAGPVSHTDAHTLGREMHADGEAIRALKSRDQSHAEWMCYVQNDTPVAVKISAPFGVLERLPQHPTPPAKPKALKPPLPPTPKVVGHVSTVTFPEFNITLPCVLDTGAAITYVPCPHTIQGNTVKFSLAGHQIERPLNTMMVVRGFNDASQELPVVTLVITVDGHTAIEDVVLGTTGRILVGRSFMAGRLNVSSATQSPRAQQRDTSRNKPTEDRDTDY